MRYYKLDITIAITTNNPLQNRPPMANPAVHNPPLFLTKYGLTKLNKAYGFAFVFLNIFQVFHFISFIER